MRSARSVLFLPVALALSGVASPSWAQGDESCAALHNTALASGFVTSARVVEATDALPAYCEVRATALPAISIEVRLPMEGWNGKYYQAGCGGFCGILGRADAAAGWVNAMRPGLERGYATATSDSGHHGLSVLDAGWAADNPHAERDWGWRSIGETHRVAQSMITAFYGSTTEEAIFQGCSTGGRMAHMAALRYPEMFQGIISGAPAMDYTGLVGTKMSYLMQANTGADGQPILKPGKELLIGDAVMAACDGLDGAEDGLISDPRSCNADLTALQCSGAAGADCLTDAELEVIAKWRHGPVNAAGEQLYPGGVPAGSEPFWWLWLTGNADGGGKLVNAFTTNFGAYMAFADDPGASWTPQQFDFETDPALLEPMGRVYNADNPDISAFRAAGGKMIVWHGWGDSIVTPFKTVDWYDRAADMAGGEAILQENVALFMLPGVDHCGILPGPGGISQAGIDPMTALERWMETGTAPSSILVGD
ncbi:tannase/feruloyl esterase family alpha/beta hydrolase [Aestuariivita sp.]|jgi:feruloyl esterase|uniref:tannase/feruloyl esterase family alpha/beta hydrolase n=1 Tax=Aestuariivita sp. TaxID=1872407 RepID=UPI002173367F|nr:tannase/feruloyl esterase family alpha/beta hydrolase [Aestuariivita sp.]MCE8006052.1 tannase/feruloyl esterase family alpha/beta hydrolase [Aestuariivita sp.]